MKTPSKKELYERISYLEAENERLIEELNRTKQTEWGRHISEAFEEARKQLKMIYGNTLKSLNFIRVDNSGYWFNYTIDFEKTLYSYSVRHKEVSS
jgi:hypothetical protein